MSKLRTASSPPARCWRPSLTLLLGSFAVTAQPAAASGVGCSGPGTITVYYNNAGKEVGRYTESCQGVCTGSGRITDTFDVLFIPCPPPGGGEA